MLRNIRILFFASAIFFIHGSSDIAFCNSLNCIGIPGTRDTVPENQVLYNGRIWRNRYFYIMGDPYLFSSTMLPGSVTINGKAFDNLKLLYDIYNDELLTLTNHNVIIQLNKEMIDRFIISFGNINYRFDRIETDKQNPPDGYVNVLYEGRTSLLVKYTKAIDLRAVDNKYDSFSQSHRIYVKMDSISTQVRNKKQLINLFGDRKQEVREFINGRKIKISGKQPDSFIPVVEYYDRLNQ